MSDVSDTSEATWPIDLGGVVESIVATRGPNERWNFAALGVQPDDLEADDAKSEAPGANSPKTDGSESDGPEANGASRSREADAEDGETIALAYTWGRTRTWRNLRERGAGYVQFARDPVLFVEAALGIHERDTPIHPATDAWVRVAASSIGVETIEDTRRETWRLRAIESVIEHRRVPRTRRGYGAVVEATVAASRLDVPTYDTAILRERLDYFERVVERCGDERERAAMARLHDLLDGA